ncbi:RNA-directed DNA polymerase (Reverse transcriptase) [Trifolium medium]|uniref:RNA-directed DNA polymerase (Reverse transcriptase) n=1 Tax=Trifolium medium TaxID=97028 RepID=A0A392LY62_9FABA|nr:RNA-directed DNA polymerase (Reverse transcriptase) [Trifolium medium]
MVSTADLDPREEFQDIRVSPIEELEQVQIGEAAHQVTNLGTALNPTEKEKILTILKNNIDLFAWKPSDMPGINESIITHKLSISPDIEPVSQRKMKIGKEMRTTIIEEVAKLKDAGFIEEIKYPSWLANVVMVKKANDKWRMCVDFTDLNKACPKDPYPLPNIDRLIDGALGYKMLSFMEAYSRYNQIKMNPLDAPHTSFMTNTCNYHYNVMPFGLKNAGATYQRLMDKVFSEQIGKNLEERIRHNLGPSQSTEHPYGVLIEQSLRFAFKASNNQAEYEALIAGMKLAKEMEAKGLKAKSDSQLVTNQVSGEFQTKDPQLNSRADLLSKLASTKRPGSHRTFIQETISKPSINEEQTLMVVEIDDWRSPIIRYLQKDELPLEKEEAVKIRKMAAWYSMVGDKLYKRGFSSPMLLCVSERESRVIMEEIHEGSCGSHIGARSLAGKILRVGFFWPNLHDDASRYFGFIPHHHKTDEMDHRSRGLLYQVGGSRTHFQHFRRSSEEGLLEEDNLQIWVTQVYRVRQRHPVRQLTSKAEAWAEHLSPILWAYHTTPQSSTGEAPFTKVYGTDAMIPVEIDPPSWRRETATLEENTEALQENLDMIEELREKAHFREFATKQRAARRYNTRVIQKRFKEGDLVLKRPMGKDKRGKLAANWEGPFRVHEVFDGGAYRLETMKGEVIPRTWNITNLKFYYS